MTTPNYSNGNWSLDFPNESVKIIHWHGFFSIILICLCSAFAIISTAGKSTIIYFILYKAPKRPMNTMILLDQVGTLVTSLVAKVMIITCLIMGIPILDLLGPLACEVFYIFTIAHNILIATGGFFMAVFRMLCVQFQNYVPSLEKLMLMVMKVHLVTFLGTFMTGYVGAIFYGSSNLLEFCNGYTTKVAHMLMRQEGLFDANRVHLGKRAITVCIALGQACVLMEFVSYIVIYWNLREKNKSFFQIVQQDVLKTRAKKNAITFTGQAIAFIFEVTYTMLVQLLLHFGSVGGFFEPGALPCALMVTMAGVTSAQVLASPELRRFIQGYD